MKSTIQTLLGFACLCLCATAAPYAVNSKVSAFKSTDQHEKPFELKPEATKYLIVSHDMKTGKKANVALDKQGAEFLGKHKAVFIANIHGMPGVGRMFALPKMRKYAHRIILADDEKLIANFPKAEDKATILKLSGGKVTSITYWDPEKQAIGDLLK